MAEATPSKPDETQHVGAGGSAPGTPERLSLGGLQILVGVIAGAAGLIYVTGGVVLGLRLLWSDLPGLTVAQLPREFLFSFGVAQVVAPAIVIGAVAGLLELGQRHDALLEGHLPWKEAMSDSRTRRTYIAFYAAMPLVLATPGAIVAIDQDERIAPSWIVVVAVAVPALIALGTWVALARASSLTARRKAQDPAAGSRGAGDSLTLWEGVAVASGFVVCVLFGGWMWLHEGRPKYLGVIGVWMVSLFAAMLVVWIRGQAGRSYRLANTAPAKEAKDRTITQSVLLSWAAAAILSVPAIIAVAAAWPLREAVACGIGDQESRPYHAAGRFVGQTATHAYIGDTDERRIISVPTARVSRLIIGDHADTTELCRRGSDMSP